MQNNRQHKCKILTDTQGGGRLAQFPRHLTQSKFFSAAFNAAIFDGPFRIYFAQPQEPLALKVYFRLQQQLGELYEDAKVLHRDKGHHLFIMLYPTIQEFESAFDPLNDNKIAIDTHDSDKVLGVRGALEDSEYEELYASLRKIIETWRRPKKLASTPRNHLELI